MILWEIICFLITNGIALILESEETNPFGREFKTLATSAQFTSLTSFMLNIIMNADFIIIITASIMLIM